MDEMAHDGGPYAETVVFLSYFKDLPDARQRGRVMYPLPEVLLLCFLAVLAGAETITDIARFSEKKLDILRRFRPFAQGTPAHDHLGDTLATLDAEQFQRCFVAWVAALIGVPEGVVANLGPKRGRTTEQLTAISGALSLLTNILITWNTMHIERRRSQRPEELHDDLLKHIAPVAHGHFNMRGIFTFDLGQYRPALLGLNPLDALLKSPKSAT